MLPVVWLHAADHHYSVKGPTIVGPSPNFSERAPLGTGFDTDGQLVASDEGSFTVKRTRTDVDLP